MENKDIIDFFKSVGKLKRMPRMGWLVVGVPKQIVESVAEHVMRTTVIALSLCQILSGKKANIDCGKVAQIAIIHDLPESIFMDVGGEARRIIGRENRLNYEKKALEILLENLDDRIGKTYLELWEEYSKKSSLEAKIVYLADKLEMFLQALEYSELGVSKELLKEFFTDFEAVNETIRDTPELNDLQDIFELVIDDFEKKL